MSKTILATKLYIPLPPPKGVRRPRLVERLNEGLHRKLTLISAPAGFGKTTLVSGWVAGGRPTAWLSLDDGDNDPTRFLAYLVAALRTVAATVGQGVDIALQSPQLPPIETVLTTLLNEITTIPYQFVLVLDDYHVIEAQSVTDAVTFLLEYAPPTMHIVIATRENPALPLARLRARDQLTELRAPDLRFTASEAARFLNQMMGLDLSAEDIATLDTRTEGWIAGLQLAAISMQGHQDTTGFIKSFAGSHRFVLDYLVEEVLQQQPESVQSFLLGTAILDRLCGPLCDAVLHGEETLHVSATSGQDTLEYLERANLLVVPLDDERQWYRYHHLFADVLQTRLMKEYPNRIPSLHQRACEWYAQNNLPSDAIHHALPAEDFQRAADLIEMEWSEIRKSCFQSPTWLGWVKALPDDLVLNRPVLCFGYASELLNLGELDAAEDLLQHAERWLDPTANINQPPATAFTKMVVVNEDEFPSLPASIANSRAYLALIRGDIDNTIHHARRTLTLVNEPDFYLHGFAGVLLGLAYWTSGDLQAAHSAIVDGMASLQLAGNVPFTIFGTLIMADLKIALGRLHEAEMTYKQTLQLAMEQGEPVPQGVADLHLGLCELYFEQGKLEAARQHLLKSEALGDHAALPDWTYHLCLMKARLKEAQTDFEGVLDMLGEAERHNYTIPIPDVRPISALRARIWIAQGEFNKAMVWALEQGLCVDDDLSYLREFEHITLARILIAQYLDDPLNSAIHDAFELLDRLLNTAEVGGESVVWSKSLS